MQNCVFGAKPKCVQGIVLTIIRLIFRSLKRYLRPLYPHKGAFFEAPFLLPVRRKQENLNLYINTLQPNQQTLSINERGSANNPATSFSYLLKNQLQPVNDADEKRRRQEQQRKREYSTDFNRQYLWKQTRLSNFSRTWKSKSPNWRVIFQLNHDNGKVRQIEYQGIRTTYSTENCS